MWTRFSDMHSGGGITYDDIADCANNWGIASAPRTMNIYKVRYMVLKSAGTNDAEDFALEQDA